MGTMPFYQVEKPTPEDYPNADFHPENAAKVGPWMVDARNHGYELTSETGFAYMGSCFALELSNALKQQGMRVIETVTAQEGSGPWGKVYNAQAAAQILLYALGEYRTEEGPWIRKGLDGKDYYLDPMRKWVVYSSMERWLEGRNELRSHTAAAVAAADVFVLTLGMTEVWGNTSGEAFYQVPPKEVFDSRKHKFWVQPAAEVTTWLHIISRLIERLNPDCRLIVSLSPVPLKATFRENVDVFTANLLSKTALREGVSRATAAGYCEYFPAYEMALSWNGWPYTGDGRHVRPEVVADIVRRFKQAYFE